MKIKKKSSYRTTLLAMLKIVCQVIFIAKPKMRYSPNNFTEETNVQIDPCTFPEFQT